MASLSAFSHQDLSVSPWNSVSFRTSICCQANYIDVSSLKIGA